MTAKTKLPIARTRPVDQEIPKPEALNKIVEVVGNEQETLEYFAQGLRTSLKEKGLLDKCRALISEVDILIENAQYQAENLGSPWLGEVESFSVDQSDFRLFQEFLAKSHSQNIQDQTIYLDCALSDNGEFKRVYSNEQGDVLEGKSLEAMDTLFNAWLAEQNLLSKGGVVYKATSEGELKLNNGEPVVVKAQELRERLQSTDEFSRFVQKYNPKTELAVRLHEYEQPTASPNG